MLDEQCRLKRCQERAATKAECGNIFLQRADEQKAKYKLCPTGKKIAASGSSTSGLIRHVPAIHGVTITVTEARKTTNVLSTNYEHGADDSANEPAVKKPRPSIKSFVKPVSVMPMRIT